MTQIWLPAANFVGDLVAVPHETGLTKPFQAALVP
jgi:hypothetical protein